MDDKLLQGLLLIIILVCLCFGFGLAARFGAFKRSFIVRTNPLVYPRNLVYALIPLGIFFLYIGIVAFTVGENWPENNVYSAGMIVTLLLVLLSLIWQPRWLKPTWLRWLEDNYGDMLEVMYEEAWQMGVQKWEAQISTQTGLEEWADSVARKHR